MPNDRTRQVTPDLRAKCGGLERTNGGDCDPCGGGIIGPAGSNPALSPNLSAPIARGTERDTAANGDRWFRM